MEKLNKYGELSSDDSACPNCGEAVKPEWKVCPVCATLLVMGPLKCVTCGVSLKGGWKACPECGTSVSRESSDELVQRSARAKDDADLCFVRAFLNDDYATALKLLEAGADIDAFDPLRSTCIKGDLAKVRWLVEHGAKVDREAGDGTPLQYASQHSLDVEKRQSYLEIMEVLIANGADVNHELDGKSGSAAVRLAGCQEAVSLLRRHGAVGQPKFI